MIGLKIFLSCCRRNSGMRDQKSRVSQLRQGFLESLQSLLLIALSALRNSKMRRRDTDVGAMIVGHRREHSSTGRDRSCSSIKSLLAGRGSDFSWASPKQPSGELRNALVLLLRRETNSAERSGMDMKREASAKMSPFKSCGSAILENDCRMLFAFGILKVVSNTYTSSLDKGEPDPSLPGSATTGKQ